MAGSEGKDAMLSLPSALHDYITKKIKSLGHPEKCQCAEALSFGPAWLGYAALGPKCHSPQSWLWIENISALHFNIIIIYIYIYNDDV